MHKLLFSFFILVALFFPKSEIFAKDVPVCTTEKINNNPVSTLTALTKNGSTVTGGTCAPETAACIKLVGNPTNADNTFSYRCYQLAAEVTSCTCPAGATYDSTNNICTDSAGAISAATCTVTNSSSCKPNDPSCTNSNGIRCEPGNGDIVKGSRGIMTAIGCIPTEPKELVNSLLKYGIMGAAGVAFLLMLLGALQMITAEGNPEAIKHAQERFYSAIIGLLLVIFAILLMQVIGYNILGLPGFGR